MLTLVRAPSQDRLNAAIYECVRLRITGSMSVLISCCDVYSLLDYLEARLRTIAATYTNDSNVFCIANKLVRVFDFHILITPMKTETSFLSSHPEGCANHTLYSPTGHS